MEVEASQNEKLGRFFKKSLPHGETARDIKLVMLGLELDKQAKASDAKMTLLSIVEVDIGKLSRSVFAMAALPDQEKPQPSLTWQPSTLSSTVSAVLQDLLSLRNLGTQVSPNLAMTSTRCTRPLPGSRGPHGLRDVESETNLLVRTTR